MCRVDCVASPSIAQSFGIQGFPTLFFGTVEQFTTVAASSGAAQSVLTTVQANPRTAEGVTAWLNTHLSTSFRVPAAAKFNKRPSKPNCVLVSAAPALLKRHQLMLSDSIAALRGVKSGLGAHGRRKRAPPSSHFCVCIFAAFFFFFGAAFLGTRPNISESNSEIST